MVKVYYLLHIFDNHKNLRHVVTELPPIFRRFTYCEPLAENDIRFWLGHYEMGY